MIERYTLPEMAALWTTDARFEKWLLVELAVMETQEAEGLVPKGTTVAVKAKAQFNAKRVLEIEEEVKHDVIAFLTNVSEYVNQGSPKGESENLGRFLHLGMTSSDLIDTALSLQIQEAGTLLLEKLHALQTTLHKQALAHQNTIMVGRSHGIHGEPITFGFKLLGWLDELYRQEARLKAALEENRVGQLTGAMGTYSHMPPSIEAGMCEKLGLNPARVTTQVIDRDRHAQFILALGSLASSLERFATEIRNLQRTDVLEVEEPFTPGQKGSSAMPHKRNPVGSENITGLARMVRSYCTPILENIALWHERDISHSSVERIVLPDATILIHYMLNRFNNIMKDLQVYPENMTRNLYRYGGVIFSQRVLLALINQGITREDAYRLVQRNAHTAWNTEGGNFKQNLLNDEEVTKILSLEALEGCFDPAPGLQHIAAIFSRFA